MSGLFFSIMMNHFIKGSHFCVTSYDIFSSLYDKKKNKKNFFKDFAVLNLLKRIEKNVQYISLHF